MNPNPPCHVQSVYPSSYSARQLSSATFTTSIGDRGKLAIADWYSSGNRWIACFAVQLAPAQMTVRARTE